jgi:putative photosynthetic complex assembly protein 2
MTTSLWIPTLFALFVWWFSTGVILLVVRRADRKGGDAHRVAALASLPVLAIGVYGVVASVPDASVAGAYTGFLAALAIWGWIELAFLTGTITGPSKEVCPPGAMGKDRLARAWATIAHHEIILAVGLILLAAYSQGQINQIAVFTYLVLFVARISAKLNIFFGVPQINIEFLPAPLQHLKSYFRQGPITPAFPAAITFLSFSVACLIVQVWQADTHAAAVGFTLLATLTTLALLEHWLLLLPLPDAKLWRWMLPASDAQTTETQ